jgi:hypothetical protein
MESILVSPFSRRAKGRFDELSVRNPITITAGAPQKPVLSLRAQTPGCFRAWRQVSGPCTLGIVGLAIAVFLWGYGYKLSLYYRDAASSARIPVAKLWIEPRSASVAAGPSLKASSHLAHRSLALSVRIQRFPGLSRIVACIPLLSECRVAFFDLLIPSRAPPPLRFLFA